MTDDKVATEAWKIQEGEETLVDLLNSQERFTVWNDIDFNKDLVLKMNFMEIEFELLKVKYDCC
jgi:hypothetical protein